MRFKLSFLLMLFSMAFIQAEYDHDYWKTKPVDNYREFTAFVCSFDGNDDDNSEDGADKWGVSEWVAFEIKKVNNFSSSKRPSTWKTDKNLYTEGLAPKDSSYAVSGVRDLSEVKTDYRYVRGHLCPKTTADRISKAAGKETHTMLNAVPQLQWQNNGIWKKLEEQCNEWANKHGRVWVVTGPVFFKKSPAVWLGQEGEKKVAVPDALYKIVIRKSESNVKVLSYLIPNILPKSQKEFNDFLTSVDRVESLTGVDFLTKLEGKNEINIEKIINTPEDW